MASSLISEFEGLKLKSYKCPAGVWTVGYGTTINPITKNPITSGITITKDEALKWLEMDTLKVKDQVKALVKVPINDNELDALTSLAYNIGAGAFKKSTLLNLLNQGADRHLVADQFLRWNKAGGKVLPGLVKRRLAEHNLFLK